MRIKLDSQAGGRRLIYAVVSLVVLAALAGGAAYAWIGRHVPIQDDAAPERVVIATIVYAGSCPVIAAQAKGYFTSEGIQAAIPAYTSGKASLDAVLAGQADLGLVADLPVMLAVKTVGSPRRRICKERESASQLEPARTSFSTFC
jgi:NitT/TauT family transport system substrate-binding protein